MKKTAIIIGFGGMGKRYFKSLNNLNFKIIAICEKNLNNVQKDIKNKFYFINNYKKLLSKKADLLCVVTNTDTRYKILIDFLKKGKIKRIITEKPLSTSIDQGNRLLELTKKKKIKLSVNNHRSLSPNYLNIKKFIEKKKEKVTHMFINSPSAGLGNMGSSFFDLGKFFFNKKPKKIVCWIDKTGTVNPRGKRFPDPGGHGIIHYSHNEKIFFDLSENTGLPYTFTIKSRNYEFNVDEQNNEFKIKIRPMKMRNKPLFFYIFKPIVKKIKLNHKFDVVKMTELTIKDIFNKNFKNLSLNHALEVMHYILACHISDKTNKIIEYPLPKKFHKNKINFA